MLFYFYFSISYAMNAKWLVVVPQGPIRHITSRVYPWVVTNLVIRAQGLE